MSDDDDVVVMKLCAFPGCGTMRDLKFDIETSEYYCKACHSRLLHSVEEGFYVLLSQEELTIVTMIFNAVAQGARYWSFAQFADYLQVISDLKKSPPCMIRSSDDLVDFFLTEYDITLGTAGGEPAVTLKDLQNIYGGFVYNGVYSALRDDAERFEQEGIINLQVVE